MGQNFYEVLQLKKQRHELSTMLSLNEKTEHFGVTLSQEDVKELIICRDRSLKKYQRVEFGEGILSKIAFLFCDSQYIIQDNYLPTLVRIQDIFYAYKNETNDKLTDDELLTFMKEQFEGVCCGDLDYLANTCLARFTEAIKAGYKGYMASEGSGEYSQLDEEPRWDYDMYLSVLKELFW